MIKIIYLLFAVGLLMTIASANDSFIVTSLKDAQELAYATDKKILLIFGTEGCPYCVKLKNELFTEPLKAAIDPYIVCYLDLDKNKELKQEYNIGMIPDSRILKNNREISRLKGYSKDRYVDWLNNVK